MSVSAPDVVVYRTGVLLDADFVAQELRRATIPCYQRSENLAGREGGMCPAPFPGPGILFTIKTDAARSAAALEIIRGLPVPQEPDAGPWAFRPVPEVRHFLRGWAIFLCLALLISLGFTVRSLLTELRR